MYKYLMLIGEGGKQILPFSDNKRRESILGKILADAIWERSLVKREYWERRNTD